MSLVHKGENVGWFLDQRLVSLMVSDWTRQHPGRVQLVYRDTIIDRSVAHKIGGVLAEALCLKIFHVVDVRVRLS